MSAIICFSALAVSCDRVSMEQSPEALVSYGVPSQHSNYGTDSQKSAEKGEDGQSWINSSAVNPKPRSDF